MNEFEDLKPRGLEEIKSDKPDPELKPVPVPPKPEVDLDLSAKFKINKIKELYADMILSGNIPKTTWGIIALALLGVAMYWVLSYKPG
jgi:hypothetical protein